MGNINYNDAIMGITSLDLQKISENLEKELCGGIIHREGLNIYYRSKLLDFSNDEIVLKIEFKDNHIRVSDNSRTILSLLSSEFDPYSTKAKKYLISTITDSCGVYFQKNGEVYVTSVGCLTFQNKSCNCRTLSMRM